MFLLHTIMIKLEFDNKKLQIDFEDLQKIIKVVGNKQDNIVFSKLMNKNDELRFFPDLIEDKINIADESISIWNGSSVVNGTYFCKLSIDNDIYWTKLMVIN